MVAPVRSTNKLDLVKVIVNNFQNFPAIIDSEIRYMVQNTRFLKIWHFPKKIFFQAFRNVRNCWLFELIDAESPTGYPSASFQQPRSTGNILVFENEFVEKKIWKFSAFTLLRFAHEPGQNRTQSKRIEPWPSSRGIQTLIKASPLAGVDSD